METFKVPKGEPWPVHLSPIMHEIERQAARHKVKVTVQMDRADRSDDQNAALWGVAYKILSEHTGYKPEELHEVFCEGYFGRVEYEVMGRQRTRPRRTTTVDENGKRNVISKIDFANFYSYIQQCAAEHLGVNVPDPDKHWRQNMEAA